MLEWAALVTMGKGAGTLIEREFIRSVLFLATKRSLS